jgi:pSer/pThr/pTyr-binding forkhead associated (FHA) protein
MSDGGEFALKFISGKYQGGEFPLPFKGEVVIGRASDVGMVLVEDMVSRKHARLLVDGPRLGIIDLGSTNGTFVNGEKVQKMELKIGDRVLVGTNILKVVGLGEVSAQAAGLSSNELRMMLEELAQARGGDTTMSGDLEEVPFPDLLQLFSSSKKSGILSIDGAHEGAVFLKEGQVVFAEISGQKMAPLKAFSRMVQWQTGHFELKAPGETKFQTTITESTESILLEALRQFDEISRIMPKMPPAGAKLGPARPMKSKLRDLTPEQLDALELFIGMPSYQHSLDAWPGTDFQAMHKLKELMDKGVIAIEK